MKNYQKGFIFPFVLIVIGVLVIGGGYYYVHQIQYNDALLKAKQAAVKSFAASIMANLIAYSSEEKNTIAYSQNVTIKANLQAEITALSEKYPGDYHYNIFDGKKGDEAIKVGETKSGIYVCIDSKTVKVVDINLRDFSKTTDCSGGSLK